MVWNPERDGAVQRYNSTTASYDDDAVPSVALSTVAESADAVSVDVSNYGAVDVTLSDDCTLALTNVPQLAGVWQVRLVVRQGDGPFAVTWPAGTVWVGGTEPTLTETEAAVDVIDLFTVDGGSVWFGVVVGQAFAAPA